MLCRTLLKSLVLPAMLLFSQLLFAQDRVVSGRVTDTTGTGLGGVTVTARGTRIATQTNTEGAFRLTVPSTVDALIFTSIGFSTLQIPIPASNSMNVSLKGATSALNEVVVVSYGTRLKKDLTGSVTAITSKDFQKGVISSSEQLLTGKVAGLQVTSGGGSAGSGSRIRIRNGASLNATNDPLIVIDGVPVDNNNIAGSGSLLNTINPNDIESMSVLKDASATALYGSRASNGVIIITTKKGTRGKLKFNFNSQESVSEISKYVDVLSGDQIRAIINADATATGSNTYKNLLGGSNTDWQKVIYQTAVGSDNNISTSGTLGNVLPFRLSLGYYYQNGILKTNHFDRKSAAINLSPKLLQDHLSFNINAKFAQTDNRWANEGAVGNAVTFDPTQPVYAKNNFGGYYEWLVGSTPLDLSNRNPLALLELRHNTSTVNRLIGNVQADYKVHFLPDLHVLFNIGIDYAKGHGNDNIDSLLATNYKTGGSKSFYKQGKKNTLTDVSLFYTKELRSIKSKFDVLATHSYEDFVTNAYSFASFSYRAIADSTHPAMKDTIQNSVPKNPTDKPEYRLESYLGRINYTFNDKYLLTASIRRDASSRFAADRRVGYFPAVALAWRLKEEFFRSAEMVNDLKLRLGWGVTGQQGLKDGDGNDLFYPYLPRYTNSNSSAEYQFGNTFYSFLRPAAYDKTIKWETTTTSNIGLDFAFFNNRISGSIDGYIKKTKDLLSVVPIAPGSNFNITLLTNVGDMENKGVEFTLNTTPVKNRDFSWDFGFNITYSTSKVTNLLKQPDATFKGIDVSGISGGTGNYIGKFAIGYAPFSYYVFKQVYGKDGKPIEGLYEDINRDGVVDANDRYLYKKPAPDVLLGINTQFTYKKFMLSASGHGAFGNYLYNNYNSNNGVLRAVKNPLIFIGNASNDYLASSFVNNQYFSDYYIENASFFRLDVVSLGYNFGKVINNKASLSVMATVQNVFVVTKFKGIDPEIANDTGVTNTIYPRPRIYGLRFNLDF